LIGKGEAYFRVGSKNVSMGKKQEIGVEKLVFDKEPWSAGKFKMIVVFYQYRVLSDSLFI